MVLGWGLWCVRFCIWNSWRTLADDSDSLVELNHLAIKFGVSRGTTSLCPSGIVHLHFYGIVMTF